MKVMIDSNIAIDALRPNPDFVDDAKNVFQLINADYIVSRDLKFIKAGTEVEVVTPKQLIEKAAALNTPLI